MPEEIDEAVFRALLRTSLPIDEIQGVTGLGASRGGPLEQVVLIWIDDQDRPDFKQTVAAHTMERQPGSFHLSWLYREMSSKTRLLLRIEMERPTHSIFHLSFSLQRDFGVLMTIAQHRVCWLVPGPARPLPAPRVLVDAETFFEEYKGLFGWTLALELSESQARDLLEFLAAWPYPPDH